MNLSLLQLAISWWFLILLHTAVSHRTSPRLATKTDERDSATTTPSPDAQEATENGSDQDSEGGPPPANAVQPAADDDSQENTEEDTGERHMLVSKYVKHIDEKQWTHYLEDSISQGWDGEKLHYPLRGEVFLDGGWTPLTAKDWKYMYRSLKKGYSEFQIKSRSQKYNISILSRTEARQVNSKSGKIRHVRFIYTDSMDFPKLDAAPKRKTAALMCANNGVGRLGSKFTRRDDHAYKAYFACHDDKGSGIDICFYKETFPDLHLCRNSVTHLNNYLVKSTGKFEISFRAFRGQKSILAGTLINNATRLQDNAFSLTSLGPTGNAITKEYSNLEAPKEDRSENQSNAGAESETTEEESEAPQITEGEPEVIAEPDQPEEVAGEDTSKDVPESETTEDEPEEPVDEDESEIPVTEDTSEDALKSETTEDEPEEPVDKDESEVPITEDTSEDASESEATEDESAGPEAEDKSDTPVTNGQSSGAIESETKQDQSIGPVSEDKSKGDPESSSKRISSQIKVDIDAFRALKKSARWAILEDLKENQVDPYKANINEKWKVIKAEGEKIKEEQERLQALQDELNQRKKAYKRSVYANKKRHGRLRKMYKKMKELKTIATYR